MKTLLLIYFLSIPIINSAQTNYKIPAGTSNNKFEIKVNNTTGKTFTDILITPLTVPEWVKVNEESIIIKKIEPAAGETAVFTFDISIEAPLHSEEELTFMIQTNEGQAVYKSFSVSVIYPDKFELKQNYPNPFNPATTIIFSIPEETRVLLKIYNILGEEVELLTNEILQPGVHNIIFDASRLASGVYFYKLEAGSFNSIKKMILLR